MSATGSTHTQRRSRHGHPDEHDGVEPDDGRDRREADRDVVEDAEPAPELLLVAELVEPPRVVAHLRGRLGDGVDQELGHRSNLLPAVRRRESGAVRAAA